MTNHHPMRPDPIPLRDALRGLRHVMRRGGETLAETLPVSALPGPAAGLAGALLRGGGALVKSVDEVASSLAKKVLVGEEAHAPSLRAITRQQGADAAFAAACYAALRAALIRLDAGQVFVSETAARLAYQQAKPAADRAPEANAADLALAMIDQKVLRDIGAADAARLPAATLEPVVLFTVLLWLQSERPEDVDEAALDSAADLAMVLAPDVTAACAARDATRLAALFAEFASHV